VDQQQTRSIASAACDLDVRSWSGADDTVTKRSPTMRTNNALWWRRPKVAVVGLVVCLLTLHDAARAQLAVPGPSGVVMGHLHLATKDVEASKRFWGTYIELTENLAPPK
jgi:hypothetical protein